MHLVHALEAVLVREGLLAVDDRQDLRQVHVLVLAVAAHGQFHAHLVRLQRVEQARHLAHVGVLGEGVADHEGEEVVEGAASTQKRGQKFTLAFLPGSNTFLQGDTADLTRIWVD